jgi:hypothetical protein
MPSSTYKLKELHGILKGLRCVDIMSFSLGSMFCAGAAGKLHAGEEDFHKESKEIVLALIFATGILSSIMHHKLLSKLKKIIPSDGDQKLSLLINETIKSAELSRNTQLLKIITIFGICSDSTRLLRILLCSSSISAVIDLKMAHRSHKILQEVKAEIEAETTAEIEVAKLILAAAEAELEKAVIEIMRADTISARIHSAAVKALVAREELAAVNEKEVADARSLISVEGVTAERLLAEAVLSRSVVAEKLVIISNLALEILAVAKVSEAEAVRVAAVRALGLANKAVKAENEVEAAAEEAETSATIAARNTMLAALIRNAAEVREATKKLEKAKVQFIDTGIQTDVVARAKQEVASAEAVAMAAVVVTARADSRNAIVRGEQLNSIHRANARHEGQLAARVATLLAGRETIAQQLVEATRVTGIEVAGEGGGEQDMIWRYQV